MNKPHKRLKAWEIGMEIAQEVYQITKTFPREEMYSLTSQMRRCAVSIPSNIAEGAARNSTKEFINFLYISLGSASELDTQLELSKRFGFIDSNNWTALDQKLQEADKVIIGLIKSQRAKL